MRFHMFFNSTIILLQCSCSTLSNFEARSSDVLSQSTIIDSEKGEESLDTSQMATSESDEEQHAESEAGAILGPRSVENGNYIPSSCSPLLNITKFPVLHIFNKIFSELFPYFNCIACTPPSGSPRGGIKRRYFFSVQILAHLEGLV